MILQKKTEFFFYAYEYLFQFLGKHHYTSYIYIYPGTELNWKMLRMNLSLLRMNLSLIIEG